MHISISKTSTVFNIAMALALFCLLMDASLAADKCNSKKVEVLKGEEVVWSGAAVDLFKQYPHGKLGSGNRPERETVRLSKLIKDIGAEKSSQVAVIACRDKSKQLATADILGGDIDIWLVGLRSDEIRMFEYKRGADKPEKDFKRVVRIQFTEK